MPRPLRLVFYECMGVGYIWEIEYSGFGILSAYDEPPATGSGPDSVEGPAINSRSELFKGSRVDLDIRISDLGVLKGLLNSTTCNVL